MQYILIIIILIGLITTIYKINKKMSQQKKVQRNSNGKVRVYHSSGDYSDYPSLWFYESSTDYSPDHSVNDVTDFGGGDFGGGGASGSYDSDSSYSDSSSSDSGGGDGGGDGGGGGD